jgi:hypothetical protein
LSVLRFDQQLFAARELLGGVQVKVFQQVAGEVGGAASSRGVGGLVGEPFIYRGYPPGGCALAIYPI